MTPFRHVIFVFLFLFAHCECTTSERNNLLTNRNFMDVMQSVSHSYPDVDRIKASEISISVKHHLFHPDELVWYTLASNDTCARDLLKWGADLFTNKTYAKLMLDSWGKPESGIFQGNLAWLGRYYECEAIFNPESSIHGQWCTGKMGAAASPNTLGMPTPGISLGICFPESCSASNISDLFKGILDRLNHSSVVTIDCPPEPHHWDSITVIWVIITAIFLLLVILGTTADIYQSNLLGNTKDAGEYEPLVGSRQKVEQTVYWRYLSSFSIRKNTSSLMSTEKKDGNIHCLHGIRFISMSWVVLGHTFVFGVVAIDNLVDLSQYALNNLSFMAIMSGSFSVDTFFFLSGLLVAFLGLREMERENGKIHVLKMYLHRYLRLTPMYAFCILLSVSIFVVIGDGPSWSVSAGAMKDLCSQYWWTNLLYINNLYPVAMASECFAWGWYLANDMQFYLTAPVFLVLLYRNPKVGVAALSIGTFCSIAITGALSSYYGELTTQQTVVIMENPELVLQRPIPKGNATASQADILASDIYAKPWCRIGVYFIGMITGYILHTTKGHIRMSRITVITGWFLTAVLELSLVYGSYFRMHDGVLSSNNVSAFYNAVCRPLWAVGLSWVVIACVSGHGGLVDKFLSWKVFIPLSRMTYTAYLVHILILYYLYYTPEVFTHYSMLTMVSIFLAAVVLTHGVAYVLTMFVEIPLLNVQSNLFPRKKSTKLVVNVEENDNE